MIASSTTWSGSPARRPARWCIARVAACCSCGAIGSSPIPGVGRSRPGGSNPGRRRAAAARETLEETGWQPVGLTPLLSYHPASGLSDQRFHLFAAGDAVEIGDPTDVSESERVEWVPIDRVADAIRGGEIVDGMSLVGLLHLLAFSM